MLSFKPALTLTSALLLIGAALLSCERELGTDGSPPPYGQAIGAVTTSILATLEGRYQTEYINWFNSLSPQEQAAEQGLLEHTRTRLLLARRISGAGELRSLGAFRMRIPILGVTPTTSPSTAALAFLSEVAPALGLVSTAPLVDSNHRTTPDGGYVARYDQYRLGYPVWHARTTVVLDASNHVTGFGAILTAETLFDDTPEAISQGVAANIVTQHYGDTPSFVELGYLSPAIATELGLLAESSLATRVYRAQLPSPVSVFVSAASGQILGDVNLNSHQHREVYSANELQYDDICHTSNDPVAESAVCPTGWCTGGICENPSTDWPGTSKAAKQRSDLVYSFWNTTLGWAGCDNNGLMKVFADDPSTGTCDAYAGNKNLVFSSDLVCIDVIGHEFSHCVDQETADLVGTIDEAAADVFGTYAEQMMTGSSSWTKADGPGCEACDNGTTTWSPGWARRTRLDLPEAYDLGYGPQPSNWSNFLSGGGSYHNTTILSHAGFLMGRAPALGTHTSWGIPVTGIGLTSASQVWFQALTACASSGMSFTDWRNCIVSKSCAIGNTECVNAADAMDAVGIWRGNFSPGWAVNGQVGTARRVVDGNVEEYVFYRTSDSNYLKYRMRIEGCFGPCWTAETALPMQIASAPQAATHSGLNGIVVCAQQTNSNVGCLWLSSSGSAENIGSSLGVTDARVSVVALDAYNAMLAWRDASTGQVKFRKYFRNRTASWSTTTTTSVAASTGPALASGFDEEFSDSNNGVWLVVRRPSDGTIGYHQFDGTTFGPELIAGRADETLATSGVSAAMYRGRLHVAGHASQANEAYVVSCGMPCTASSDWTRWVKQEWDAYVTTPHLDGRKELKAWFTEPGTYSLAYRVKRSE